MPLSIRDERIDQLAERAQKILNAPTKTDAIRQALERVVETSPEAATVPQKPRAERLNAIRDRYQSMGAPNPDFDEKAFLDEMWET